MRKWGRIYFLENGGQPVAAAQAPTVDSTEIVPLFPTLVWKMQLSRDTYEPINAKIKAKLMELAQSTPGLAPGGKLQTDQTLHRLPEFQELGEIIHSAAAGVLDFLKIVYESLELTGCWANISPPGDGHRPHTHPNNYLSGVYYVQTQEGADTISFDDPRPQTNIISRPPGKSPTRMPARSTSPPGRVYWYCSPRGSSTRFRATRVSRPASASPSTSCSPGSARP
jgi:uncharacterized protein (TIGR02466 family)